MPPVKRPLTFISEGVSDISTQKTREELKQKQFENAKLRKNRKSLEEQLRNNARKKHIEFKNKVKKGEKFNKLNHKELNYYQNLQDLEEKKEKELNQFITDSMDHYETKKKLAERKKSSVVDESEENTAASGSNAGLKTVIQKMDIKLKRKVSKQKKIGVKLKTLSSRK